MIFFLIANGLEFLFDVKTTLNISDITFYESQSMHGYDLYASASDKEDILYLNLFSGKCLFADIFLKKIKSNLIV